MNITQTYKSPVILFVMLKVITCHHRSLDSDFPYRYCIYQKHMAMFNGQQLRLRSKKSVDIRRIEPTPLRVVNTLNAKDKQATYVGDIILM